MSLWFYRRNPNGKLSMYSISTYPILIVLAVIGFVVLIVMALSH